MSFVEERTAADGTTFQLDRRPILPDLADQRPSSSTIHLQDVPSHHVQLEIAKETYST